jgi:adenylate cyclase
MSLWGRVLSSGVRLHLPASPSGVIEAWRKSPRTGLLARIETRVCTPADTATRRFQKVLVVVVSLVGSVATVFNALALFNGGLAAMGWTYIGSAVYLLVGGLLILAIPSAFESVTFVLLADVLLFPTAIQVLSGGFSSGIIGVPWTLLAPLGAALVLGARAAIAHMGLFVVAVGAVAVLEPYSRSIAPEISPDVLVSFNIPSLLTLGGIASVAALYLVRQVERFRHQADALLLNVLPASVAERLKGGEAPIADGFDNVTVLFADIVGFTTISSEADPSEIVNLLNDVFSDFDDLAARHGVEKIKTIGDAYMAATGLSERSQADTEAVIDLAVDMLAAVEARTGPRGEPIRLRIGIDAGPTVAGVIGHERFIYDLWGDAVNVASRMESEGVIDHIQVTRAVRDRVGSAYGFEERGPIDVKGKGMTVTYTLTSHSLQRRP